MLKEVFQQPAATAQRPSGFAWRAKLRSTGLHQNHLAHLLVSFCRGRGDGIGRGRNLDEPQAVAAGARHISAFSTLAVRHGHSAALDVCLDPMGFHPPSSPLAAASGSGLMTPPFRTPSEGGEIPTPPISTYAPAASSSAQPRPIPHVPPVTKATRPSRPSVSLIFPPASSTRHSVHGEVFVFYGWVEACTIGISSRHSVQR